MVEEFRLSGACRTLLRKLYNSHYIGGKHTEERSVLRAIKHLPKKEQKLAKEDWEWCKKQGLVIAQLKTNDVHVSLNPRRLMEISRSIELHNGDEDES